jgi:hypothetical protein
MNQPAQNVRDDSRVEILHPFREVLRQRCGTLTFWFRRRRARKDVAVFKPRNQNVLETIGRERPSLEQGLKFSLLHLDVFDHRGCVRLWGTRRDCAGQYSAAAGYVNRAYQGMLTTLQKEQQTLVAFASLILVKRRVVRGALFSSTARMRRAEIARVTRHVSGRVQKLSL